MALKMKYFVLKPEGKDLHNRASREALRAYANEIIDADEPVSLDMRELAYDVLAWYDRETIREDENHK